VQWSLISAALLPLLLLLLLQGELAAKTGDAAAAGQASPEAAAAAAQAQLSGSHRHIAELLLEQVRGHSAANATYICCFMAVHVLCFCSLRGAARYE
jgi:hypothetical protein